MLIQREGVFPTIWLESVWLLLTTALMSALPYVRRERDESAPLR
ncbi:MAG TPA: hypothetical protein VIC27_08280 [Ktedonobacterales bacterium]